MDALLPAAPNMAAFAGPPLDASAFPGPAGEDFGALFCGAVITLPGGTGVGRAPLSDSQEEENPAPTTPGASDGGGKTFAAACAASAAAVLLAQPKEGIAGASEQGAAAGPQEAAKTEEKAAAAHLASLIQDPPRVEAEAAGATPPPASPSCILGRREAKRAPAAAERGAELPGRTLLGETAGPRPLDGQGAAGRFGPASGAVAELPPPDTTPAFLSQGTGSANRVFPPPPAPDAAPAAAGVSPIPSAFEALAGRKAPAVEAMFRPKGEGEGMGKEGQDGRPPVFDRTPPTLLPPQAEAAGKAAPPLPPAASSSGAPPSHRYGEAQAERFVITRSDPSSVSVSLSPEGLGDLEVEVFLDRGAVSGRITAFDPAAREAVEGSIGRIVEALAREGIRVGGFSVSLGEQNRRGAAFGGKTPAEEGVPAEIADVFPAPSAARAPWGAGIVDIYA